MSAFDKDHFTDMDGQPVEDSLESLPCPFCGSGAENLVVERWSDEDDPRRPTTSNVSSAAVTVPRLRPSSRPRRGRTAAAAEDRESCKAGIQLVAGCPASNGTEVSHSNATLRSQK